jgi:outer membrane protein assembly factor BamB
MRRIALLACAVLVPCLLDAGRAAAEPDARSLNFHFRLDNDYSTSAGVFDAGGTLVRTLWGNRRYTAGPHDASWDGRDDDGRPVPDDVEYEIRMLTHNVIYTWDGVIGNTSPDPTSPVHHDAPDFFNDLVVSGDRAFFTTSDEGRVPTMRYFRLNDPHSWHARPALPLAYDATMGLVTADRERVYWAHDSSPWAHTWGNGGDQAFVMATDRDLSREIEFEAGTPTCVHRVGQRCYRDDETDGNIRSAIDVVTDFREDPRTTTVFEGARNNVTGLAVQTDGPLLFAAHGSLSPARIHVLDKRSGRLLARIPIEGVGRLVAVPGSNELWAIHDLAGRRVVSHLAIGPAPDYSLTILRTLQGLESPLALSVTPDGAQVVVAEGGASQQVLAFDADSGEPVWQLGENGGYAVHGPTVNAEKFSFHRRQIDPRTSRRFEHALLGFAPDGSLWVGDTALSRLLEFDSRRRNVDEVAFLPRFYSTVVDRGDPSRVFMGYTEYAVDYTKPLDRSWRLVRFFGDSPQLTMDHLQWATGFVDVATLGNGRTYGLARTTRAVVDVMEVPMHGDLKRFAIKLQQPAFLDREGDLYGIRSRGTAGPVEVWQRPLRAFDGDGTPSWGREESRVRVPRAARDPRPSTGGAYERGVAQLSPDLNVIFDPWNSDAGRFHLAAIRDGSDRLLWRASPASGRFDLAQPDGVFDFSRPAYAGMQVSALGDQIVYNYHGEFWRGGQANQFLHWYRDGLFVGQFGVPDLRALPPGAPGMAGNSFSIQLVSANGQTYLWHNDENAHAGIHRWHLDGIEWMRELKGRGRTGQAIDLAGTPTAEYASGDRTAPTGLVAQVQSGRVRLAWESHASGASGIEVQRLQPTYIGPRFERLAALPPNATSFLDREPLNGEPTVYRVRALVDGGASDYSNHVHVTAPAKALVLESQTFEKPPPDLRDVFRQQPTPDVQVGTIADPADPANRVMRVMARRPAGASGTEFRVFARWKASPELFEALNASLGRARGSRPDIYRVQFKVRFLQAHVSNDSEVSVQVDSASIFATPGRQENLIALAGAKPDHRQSAFESVSFDFAALPNGDGARGLQQYRAAKPTEVGVAFPLDLRGDGDAVEFLVDDLTISRLDPP